MTYTTNTVSNSSVSNNPDFEVGHDAIVSGSPAKVTRWQGVKLIDSTEGSTTPIGTAANPMHVQGTAVGGDVNIAEYGGAATSLGQKAEASSIPVTLATEQDSAESWTDDFFNTRYMTVIGGVDTSNNTSTYPIPLITNGQAVLSASYLRDVAGNNLAVATTTPGSSDRALVTRSINYGSNSGTPTAEATNSLGEQRVVSGYAATTTDTITSLGDSVVADVTGYQTALIEVSGTYNSVNCVMELSVDGGSNYTTTYFRALSSNVNLNATGSLTNSRALYRVTVAGATHVKVRSTGYGSGTMTVKICPSAFPAESVDVSTVYQGSPWGTYIYDQVGNSLDQQDANWTSQYGIPFLFYDSANAWWSAMQGDINGPFVQINGQVSTLELFRHGTATLSNVSASASSVTLLASNTNRRKAHFYNDSAYVCYLKFGSSASSTSFTTIVQPGGYFAIDNPPPYYGIVTGAWASASGTMRVTEETF